MMIVVTVMMTAVTATHSRLIRGVPASSRWQQATY